MDRRELLAIIGAGLVAGRQAEASHDHVVSAASLEPGSYQPRFLSEDEYKLIDRLCEIIVPSDDQSPGAHKAGVPFFIDTTLNYSRAEEQQTWRKGLQVVSLTASSKFGRPFLTCTPAEQKEIVALMARNETNPTNELEQFFRPLKHMTLEAYVLSTVGMEEYLGYRGNTALTEFLGCTHPEHQH